jgi:hypothetical protein
VYVAEQITRLVHVGTQLSAGQPLAYYKKSGTCLETGWSAADGSTLAQATTGYTEGQVTGSGVSFAHFLSSVGVQGPFELARPGSNTRIPNRPSTNRRLPLGADTGRRARNQRLECSPR